MGRALFDSYLEIVGHAHRQCRRLVTRCTKTIQRAARSRKDAAERCLIGVERRHGHDAPQTKAPESEQSLGLRGNVRERQAALGFLGGHVHLEEGVEAPPKRAAELVDRVGKAWAVEGVQEVEARKELHLVALKVSNQVPANWGGDEIHLREGFLHAVFADVGNSGVPSRLNSIWAVGLCHCNDDDLLAMTAAPRCRIDSLANFS